MSRDLRRYALRTNYLLILGSLLLVFVVGDGLIYLIYGREAAITGLICLMAALIPVLIVVLVLLVFQWVVKRNNPE